MPVITLTTAWMDDFYVAALKGILVSYAPAVQVIDLSHRTPVFQSGIDRAAYLLRHSYAYYPKGTVHLISVESEFTENTPFIAAWYDNQYFVGTDNGIFSLIFSDSPRKMVRIEKYSDELSPNYPAISVFAPAAIHLACGRDMDELGSPYLALNPKHILLPILSGSSITGTVICINTFGNGITNISRDDFEKVGKGRPFEMMIQRVSRKITRINKYFHETSSGEQLALFNMSGYLEVAMNKGNIAEVLNLNVKESNVIIKFIDA
ncbi:MAG: SAM-dependent chlorinase/fluorinase [Bacteroidales bacterium]|jgi:S-adenosylmethionine hydrolase|nr:SAM-dependent chlorinase/fluorinase [Bacteroidales bacterium]